MSVNVWVPESYAVTTPVEADVDPLTTSPISNVPLKIADRTIVATDWEEAIPWKVLLLASRKPADQIPSISEIVMVSGSEVASNSVIVPSALEGVWIILAPTVNV